MFHFENFVQHLTNPVRFERQRFQPFPPAPQPNKPGGKVSLTDRWAYLKLVLLTYRLSSVDQLARIKPDRSMSNEHTMVLLELLIQLVNCLKKSEEEQNRILRNNFIREFKLIMRQMFWVGRYDPSVMKEAMLELKHHVYAKDKLEIVDRTKHEKFLQQTTIERDQLKQQVDRNRKGKFSSERVFSLFSVRKFEKNSNRTRKRNESINQFERKRYQTTQQKTGRIRRGTSKTCRTDANRRTKRFFRRSSRENFAIFFLRFASKRVGQKTFNRPKSISLGSIVRPTNRRRTSTAHSNQH